MRQFLTALLLLALPSCAMVMTPKTGAAPAFLVFFDEHSASLDSAGAGVIAQAAAAAKAAPGSPVVVLGYTDSAGNPSADVTLSQRRAQAVSDALVADGVAPGRIARHGRGQTHEDPGQASRRVEIDIGS
jgi:outer membrane protein OmpA-like peptidoglycan-associated protein